MYIKKILQNRSIVYGYLTALSSASNFTLTFILSRHYQNVELLYLFSIVLYFVQLFNSLCLKPALLYKAISIINIVIFLVILLSFSYYKNYAILIFFVFSYSMKDIIRYLYYFKNINLFSLTIISLLIFSFPLFIDAKNYIISNIILIILLFSISTFFLFNNKLFSFKISDLKINNNTNFKILLSDMVPMLISITAINGILFWNEEYFSNYREYLSLYGVAGLLISIKEYQLINSLKIFSSNIIGIIFGFILIIFTINFTDNSLIYYYYSIAIWISYFISHYILSFKFSKYEESNNYFYCRIVSLILCAFLLYPLIRTELFFLYFPLINLLELLVYKIEYK